MDQSIDVEQIMKQIREEINEKGYVPSMLSFDEEKKIEITKQKFILKRFQIRVQGAMDARQVTYRREFIGKPFIDFRSKVMNKLMSFGVTRMTVEQNVFNDQVAHALVQMVSFCDEQQKKINELEKRIAELEAK